MQRIPQRGDKMWMVILAAFLTAAPLLAQGPALASRASSGGVLALAAAAPAGAGATNETATNTRLSHVPANVRSERRTKAGVLAAGALIAITILIVACGLALLSSFKKR